MVQFKIWCTSYSPRYFFENLLNVMQAKVFAEFSTVDLSLFDRKKGNKKIVLLILISEERSQLSLLYDPIRFKTIANDSSCLVHIVLFNDIQSTTNRPSSRQHQTGSSKTFHTPLLHYFSLKCFVLNFHQSSRQESSYRLANFDPSRFLVFAEILTKSSATFWWIVFTWKRLSDVCQTHIDFEKLCTPSEAWHRIWVYPMLPSKLVNTKLCLEMTKHPVFLLAYMRAIELIISVVFILESKWRFVHNIFHWGI